jgi:predicted Zn-dependent protease
MALDAKDYAAAEKWATEGIEIDVMDANLHRVVAESAARRHNYTKAVEEYETAVELKPDDSKTQLALADALVQAKQPAKAREVLKRLLKREPDHPGAKKLLESIKDVR